MNKNNIRFLVGLLGLVVIGCAVAVFIKGRLATDVPGSVGSPSADAISTPISWTHFLPWLTLWRPHLTARGSLSDTLG